MAKEGQVDVAGMRGASILADLALRDFTVNAMAVPVDDGDLLDPFGGREHLREKRLVVVSDRVFLDDPVRLMRAVRFCHTLGLSMEPSLETLLRSQVSELGRVAQERIANEMNLTLAQSPSAQAVRSWDELGLLVAVLPEVSASWRNTGEGEGTMSALERMDRALAHPSSWFPQSADVVSERLVDPVDGAWTRAAALPLAVVTSRLSPGQVSVVARRLRLSAVMQSLLRSAGDCFRGGRCSPAMLKQATQSPRAVVQFLWDSAPWEPELIILAASWAAALPDDIPPADAAPATGTLDTTRKLMASWAERSTGVVPALPLDGNTLMREFNLIPGPRLGEILRELRLAWEAKEVITGGEALALAKELIEGS
jgi:hypothetical protein